MSYDDLEISVAGGASIRLYSFLLGTREWRYCTGEIDTVYQGAIYYAAPIDDSGLKQKGSAVTDDFTVTIPSSYPIPALFRGTPPSQPIKLSVRQQQYGDLSEAPLMWVGYVSSVKYRDEVASDVLCNTQAAYLARRGLRLAYSRECPHALYDNQCRVDKTLWAEPIRITSLSGVALIYDYVNAPLSGNRLGRFINGLVEWPVSDSWGTWMERRAIQTHELFQGTEFVLLLGQTDGLAAGMTVTLYQGCNRTPQNCQLFNNIPNYGGFPFLPGRSPFDGDPVF